MSNVIDFEKLMGKEEMENKEVVYLVLYGMPLGEGIIGVLKEEKDEEITVSGAIGIKKAKGGMDILPISITKLPTELELKIKKDRILLIEKSEYLKNLYDEIIKVIKVNTLGFNK